jgi:hypothetical protein
LPSECTGIWSSRRLYIGATMLPATNAEELSQILGPAR